MKKRLVMVGLVLAMAAWMTTSCKQKGEGQASASQLADSVSTEAEAADLRHIRVDSVVIDTTWALKDQDLAEWVPEGDGPHLKAVIDVPSFKQAPVLANAVMEWMGEQLGVPYHEKMDGKALLRGCVKHILSGDDETGLGSDVMNEFHIRKVYENDQVITFLIDGYDYAISAAHGMGYTRGATFRKTDGKVFDWNMIDSRADLQPILKAGLMKYFEVTSNSKLEEELMMDEVYSAGYLPKPITEPWVDADGIHFIYQSYEIAPYSAGQPEVVVPIAEAKKLLTATAANLFQ